MSAITSSDPVGTIVAQDARTAEVFTRLGIDFCCGGRLTLAAACETRRLDVGDVLSELQSLDPAAGDVDERTMTVSALIDRIVTTHHAFVRRQTPAITEMLRKLVARHAERHPELREVETVFARLADELMVHMRKEEKVLFPYMRALDEAQRAGRPAPVAPFGTVANPIAVMEDDHRRAGSELEAARSLTRDYALPADACATWHACYAALEAYERDLHLHVHLENNILFPAAVALEPAAEQKRRSERHLAKAAGAIAAALLYLTATTHALQQANAQSAPTVLGIMLDSVMPESDAIFEIVDPPKTGAEWAAARSHAVKLQEAGPQMLDPALAKDNGEWVTQVRAYADAAGGLIKAIDAKNFDAFLAASDATATTCVDCHKVYLKK